MKKIPTVFERDWDGDRFRVTEQVHPGCEWVIEGEGVPTRKIDGTCCLVRDGRLYKRHEVREGKTAPEGFERVEDDGETGKTVGWVPVGGGPEDRWHREAWDETPIELRRDGTYELIGPKIQGNPEGVGAHRLVPHTAEVLHLLSDPRTFEDLREFFVDAAAGGLSIEGIVWHHPDGRMAKIKSRDFGVKRAANAAQEGGNGTD